MGFGSGCAYEALGYGAADTGKPDASAVTNGDGVATQMLPPYHAGNRLTGNESMWGVAGKFEVTRTIPIPKRSAR